MDDDYFKDQSDDEISFSLLDIPADFCNFQTISQNGQLKSVDNVNCANDSSPKSRNTTEACSKHSIRLKHGFDSSASETYFYPVDFPIRKYQFNIANMGFYDNLLVCLPTGTGKTLIAAVIIYNFMRWYPHKKVIFMAPTKPLVSQQMKACSKMIGMLESQSTLLTGTIVAKKRIEEWNRFRLFFTTPQVMQNDLSKGLCDANDIILVIFDEAHRATRNYSYCQVIKELTHSTDFFRVIALTASPGSNLEAVQSLVDNLKISKVHVLTEESPEIKAHSHTKEVEHVIVKLTPEILWIVNSVSTLLANVLHRLVQHRAVWNADPKRCTRYILLMCREEYRKKRSMHNSKTVNSSVESDFGISLSICTSLDLLIQHGLLSFCRSVSKVISNPDCYNEVKVKSELSRNTVLMEKIINYCRLIDGSTNCYPSGVPVHPKLMKLTEVILNYFRGPKVFQSVAGKSNYYDYGDSGENRKALIFTQYRDSVEEIVLTLSVHTPTVKVMSFVGQASSGKSSKGLTQKEQLLAMDRFKKGDFNVLVSTSVGEEGLDIGELDLIVCFDALSSPLRTIQRMGRTGRHRAGRVVILVTEGREENALSKGEKQMKAIKGRAMETSLKNLSLFRQTVEIMPRGVQMVCIHSNLALQQNENSQPVLKNEDGFKNHDSNSPPLPNHLKLKKTGKTKINFVQDNKESELIIENEPKLCEKSSKNQEVEDGSPQMFPEFLDLSEDNFLNLSDLPDVISGVPEIDNSKHSPKQNDHEKSEITITQFPRKRKIIFDDEEIDDDDINLEENHDNSQEASSENNNYNIGNEDEDSTGLVRRHRRSIKRKPNHLRCFFLSQAHEGDANSSLLGSDDGDDDDRDDDNYSDLSFVVDNDVGLTQNIYSTQRNRNIVAGKEIYLQSLLTPSVRRFNFYSPNAKRLVSPFPNKFQNLIKGLEDKYVNRNDNNVDESKSQSETDETPIIEDDFESSPIAKFNESVISEVSFSISTNNQEHALNEPVMAPDADSVIKIGENGTFDINETDEMLNISEIPDFVMMMKCDENLSFSKEMDDMAKKSDDPVLESPPIQTSKPHRTTVNMNDHKILIIKSSIPNFSLVPNILRVKYSFRFITIMVDCDYLLAERVAVQVIKFSEVQKMTNMIGLKKFREELRNLKNFYSNVIVIFERSSLGNLFASTKSSTLSECDDSKNDLDISKQIQKLFVILTLFGCGFLLSNSNDETAFLISQIWNETGQDSRITSMASSFCCLALNSKKQKKSQDISDHLLKMGLFMSKQCKISIVLLIHLLVKHQSLREFFSSRSIDCLRNKLKSLTYQEAFRIFQWLSALSLKELKQANFVDVTTTRLVT